MTPERPAWMDRSVSETRDANEHDYAVCRHRRTISELKEQLSYARMSDPELRKNSSRELAREYWQVASKLLRSASLSQFHEGGPASSDLGSFLHDLHLLFDEICHGIIPETVDAARAQGGGKPYSRFQRVLIAKAIFYLEASEQGIVQTKSPVANVADAFNVSKQTVRNWKQQGAMYTDEVDPPHHSQIQQSMIYAGQKYRVLGRGGTGSN